MSAPKLIITCDDFGMSEAINKGAIDAVKAGVISSVQVLINYPGAQDAVLDLAKAIRESGNQCGIGLHLCTTAGPSTMQKSNGLVRRLGNQYFFTPFPEAEVGKHAAAMKEELNNQYDLLAKVIGAEKIDSITSHHNIHYFADNYFKIMTDMSKKATRLPIPMRSPMTWNRDRWPKMEDFKDKKLLTGITKDAIGTGLSMDKDTRKAVRAATAKRVLHEKRKGLTKQKISRPHTAYDFFYGAPSLRSIEFCTKEIQEKDTRGWTYSTEIFTHLANNNKEKMFENVNYDIEKRYEEYKVMMNASTKKFLADIQKNGNVNYGSYQKVLNGRKVEY